MRLANTFAPTLTALLFGLTQVPNSIAVAQTCAVPPNHIIAWWTGDATTVDIEGAHNGKLIDGATYGTGMVGQAFSLDGTGAYVEAPKSPAWGFGSKAFTIDLWVNFNSVKGGGVGSLPNVFVGDDAGGGDQNKWVFAYGSGVLFFHINGPDIGPMFLAQTPFSPTPGTWYFLAVTKDSSGTYTMWIDGAPATATAQMDTTPIPQPSVPLTIGQAEGLGYFNGFLDEIQIFTRTLTATEMQAIFSAGSAGVCQGLSFSPSSLKFPRQIVGTTSAATPVTVTDAFPSGVTVASVKTSGDFTQTNNCTSLPAAATCTVNVTFAPTQSGTRKGDLTVVYNAPESPQKVSLSGTATDISLSETRLNLGSKAVGTTSRAKSVTATNVGSTLVTFTGSGIVLAGTDPGDFIISANTCGPSLATNTSCTVSIEFMPTATGTRTATLEFNDNGGASPQTVALTGSGT